MSYQNIYQARSALVAACNEMTQLGINQGTSGNISLRYHDIMLISPSGIPYEEMEPGDVVEMSMDGEWVASKGMVPSSEWRFHLDILRNKPEVNAVVHAHPTYCTTLAILHKPIPAIHYMIAVGGGNTIPCAPYATYGTEELTSAVKKWSGIGKVVPRCAASASQKTSPGLYCSLPRRWQTLSPGKPSTSVAASISTNCLPGSCPGHGQWVWAGDECFQNMTLRGQAIFPPHPELTVISSG